MSSSRNAPVPVATYTDKYGEERVIHKAKNGLQVKRQQSTPVLLMTAAAGRIIGARIKALRVARGMTLKELCMRAGLASVYPKNRIWEIENGKQEAGVRFGTLYAIAVALDVEASTLLPTNKEVAKAAGVETGAQIRTIMLRKTT